MQHTRHNNARKLFSEIDLNPHNYLIIHYSCESFYDIKDGHTPRITSIAVYAYATAQTDSFSKLATTSSTGGLLLALQRAIVTTRPKGRYRKHFCWPAIKRYYSNLLVSILLLALLYTFELLHLLYCQSFQHNIL